MAKERKQLYEGMYILNASLSEEARKKALDKLSGQIVEKGGEVHKIIDWERRRLAYQIDGKREGHYYLFYFTAPSLVLDELWREYHLNEDLIRFMSLQAEVVPEKIEFKALGEMS